MKVLLLDTRNPDFGDAALSLAIVLIALVPFLFAARAVGFEDGCAAWSEPKPSVDFVWVPTPEGGFPVFHAGDLKARCLSSWTAPRPWLARALGSE